VLRNVKTKARKAVEKIVRRNRVHKRVALTATPVVNDLIDLYSQLDLVQPGQWGTWVDFAVRYCNGVQNEFGWFCKGETHVEELQHRFGGALRRVDRFSVGAELPEFTRNRVTLLRERLDEDAMLEYDAIQQQDLIGDFEIGTLTRACKALSEAKRQAALEEIERLTDAHYKIAVFTWFRETATWLARRLKKMGHLVFGPLHSKVAKKKRLDTVQALAACPMDELKQLDKSAVFVGTLRTAGQAMDELKCCGCGVVVDLWYVPMTLMQAEGRLHRIGRRGEVDWNYLVAEGTVDQLFFSHLQRKAGAISRALGDSAATSLCETLGGTDEEGDLKALMAALAACPDEDEED
jgi:SWI/SNF-related matrix-associated actin-dependent regulator 1 of chromatin subfamily A